jgi:hypothetical protein
MEKISTEKENWGKGEMKRGSRTEDDNHHMQQGTSLDHSRRIIWSCQQLIRTETRNENSGGGLINRRENEKKKAEINKQHKKRMVPGNERIIPAQSVTLQQSCRF